MYALIVVTLLFGHGSRVQMVSSVAPADLASCVRQAAYRNAEADAHARPGISVAARCVPNAEAQVRVEGCHKVTETIHVDSYGAMGEGSDLAGWAVDNWECAK